ncbi:MAG: DUF5684 domain-containing protein [Candidatus Moraniibacteriota bacterium]
MNQGNNLIQNFLDLTRRAFSDISFSNFFETSSEYFLIRILFFCLFLVIIYYIYIAICLSKIARKTNTPNAWFAWIPIFNFLLALHVSRKPEWWVFLFFIPIINIIISILVWMGIFRALGRPEWLGVLIIITPINLIIPGYLAFSQNKTSSQGPTVIASI